MPEKTVKRHEPSARLDAIEARIVKLEARIVKLTAIMGIDSRGTRLEASSHIK